MYIPFDWKADFTSEYLKEIEYYCLVMTENYIKTHFADIKNHASAIEQRIDDSQLTMQSMIEENAENLHMCKKYANRYILIDESYNVDVEL